MTTRDELMRAILESPFDNGPRLVYADWLDEHGEPERAEFIRLQCRIAAINREIQSDEDCENKSCTACEERRSLVSRMETVWYSPAKGFAPPEDWKDWAYTTGEHMLESTRISIKVERGFPSEVRMTMAEYVGGECRKCYVIGEPDGQGGFTERRIGCNNCKGTGRTPGLAKEIFSKWPVTRVVLTEPAITNSTYGGSRWRVNFEMRQLDPNIFIGPFRSRESAEEYQSRIAVHYGRQLAGLPPIQLAKQ